MWVCVQGCAEMCLGISMQESMHMQVLCRCACRRVHVYRCVGAGMCVCMGVCAHVKMFGGCRCVCLGCRSSCRHICRRTRV
jgi:hypothetical protein